ncbi:hypothetical protein QL996_04530 [Planococcus sp. APC 4015]|nr:hypothetical protein [Planococcus sp. APC 4015]
MTRFAIDAPTALRLIDDDRMPAGGNSLVAPAILRSDALSMLYRAVRSGDLDERAGRDALDKLAALKVRLLADRVSRATAWKLAAHHDWDDTHRAEYLAVAVLQADALITGDDVLAAAVVAPVRRADYEEMF